MVTGKRTFAPWLKRTLAVSALVLVAATPDESPVADAAQRGEAEEIRNLLRQGADPSAAQPDGMTALHWSALNDQLDIVETLIFAGATLQPATRVGGYTPLHLASRAGNAGVVAALLDAGANPDILTGTGAASLHFAAEADALEVVNALAGHGADVNVRDGYSSRTPAMFAAARNSAAALQALLDAGADPDLVSDTRDFSEIEAADREERTRRQRIREAEKDPEPEEEPGAQRPGQGRGGFPGAGAGQGNEPEIPPDGPKVLSSIEQIGIQGGFSPLHYAVRNGHADAMRVLVDGGAEINLPSADQSSPLLLATINGNYDLARTLLEAGADPNLLSDDGAGPLFAALNIEWSLRTWYPQPQAFRQQETDYLELMQLLLDAGADPDARTTTHIWYAAYNAGRMGVDFAGATPFWRAAYAADVQAMRLLLDNGADPNIWTYNLINPRRFFFQRPGEPEEDPSGLEPVPHGGLGVHPLHAASGVGFGTSRVAQTHRHVPDGWLPAVRFLVDEVGIDPNIRDKDGFAPIHHAAARGDNETILFLVERGADVTLLSRRGHTVADMANSPEQRAQPHPPTVALLEKLGSKNNHNCRSC
ncbi:MAG: ankyrin repeat domain-containing protein [Gammaproteobacteria bacterium]|nr:ankyrin repeat domain-containing protein [Gammaproteobacteria bacterium]